MTSSNTRHALELRLADAVAVHQALLTLGEPLAHAADALINAYRHGHKAIFFGNGGSAADAQHLAAELVGRYYQDRRPLPALALTTNSSSVTAIANDYGYSAIFSRQVEALGNAGDVAVAISTSGNSPNVLEAVRVAKARGLVTVGMTGKDGGALREEVDHLIAIPSTDTPRIQEAHILVGHIWCELVEAAMMDETP